MADPERRDIADIALRLACDSGTGERFRLKLQGCDEVEIDSDRLDQIESPATARPAVRARPSLTPTAQHGSPSSTVSSRSVPRYADMAHISWGHDSADPGATTLPAARGTCVSRADNTGSVPVFRSRRIRRINPAH